MKAPSIDPSKIATIVQDCISEALTRKKETAGIAVAMDTPLLGGGLFDSLGLVTVVVDIEQALDAECGVALSIVSEQAMSRRHSPFRSVQSLVDYVCELIAEAPSE